MHRLAQQASSRARRSVLHLAAPSSLAAPSPVGRGPSLDGQTVVCIITGHGLKDPDTAMKIEADMQEVPADFAAVEAAMGLS